MWWFAIPAIVAGSYVMKKLFEEDEPQKSILDTNFEELKRVIANDLDSKKIAILGQPGAGKSSMLLGISKAQCIPNPIVGQQTDATNWSMGTVTNFFNIYNDYKFVDVPGYDTYYHPIESFLSYFPFYHFDMILLLIKDKIYSSDERIFNHITEIFGSLTCERLVIIRSFSDFLSEQEKEEIKYDFNLKFQIYEKNIKIIFISNRYEYGIDEIKSVIYR